MNNCLRLMFVSHHYALNTLSTYSTNSPICPLHTKTHIARYLSAHPIEAGTGIRIRDQPGHYRYRQGQPAGYRGTSLLEVDSGHWTGAGWAGPHSGQLREVSGRQWQTREEIPSQVRAQGHTGRHRGAAERSAPPTRRVQLERAVACRRQGGRDRHLPLPEGIECI